MAHSQSSPSQASSSQASSSQVSSSAPSFRLKVGRLVNLESGNFSGRSTTKVVSKIEEIDSDEEDNGSAGFYHYAKKYIIVERSSLSKERLDKIVAWVVMIRETRVKDKHSPTLALALIINIFEMLGIDWSDFDHFHLTFNLPIGKGKKRGQSINVRRVRTYIAEALYELSIIIYYVNEAPHNREYYAWIINLLSVNPHLPTNFYGSVIRNSTHCLLNLSCKLIKLDIPLPPFYSTFNPSIVRCDKGYLINLRAANYVQKDGTGHRSREADGVIRTRNYLLGLDNSPAMIWWVEIADNSKTKRYPTNVQGMEDCRIFWLNHDKSDVTKIKPFGLINIVNTGAEQKSKVEQESRKESKKESKVDEEPKVDQESKKNKVSVVDTGLEKGEDMVQLDSLDRLGVNLNNLALTTTTLDTRPNRMPNVCLANFG